MAGLLDFLSGRPRTDYETGLPESIDAYTDRTLLDPNIVTRGSMLPIGKDKSGDIRFVAPEFAVDAMKAYALPDHVRRGGSYGVDDAVNASLEQMGGGLLSSRAIPNAVPEGDVLGQFIGRTSNLADRQLLKKAKSMLSKKSPKDQIWDEDAYRATGWFKDIDGQWKFEIDDSKVKVDEGAYKKFRRTPVFQGVGDFIRKMDKGEIPIKHRGSMTRESLMPRDTGYPDIDSGLVYRLPTNKGTLGEIHPDIPVLTGIANPPRGLLPNPVTGVPMHKYGKLGTIKKDMPLFRDNLLHETQHHIAGREGFGIGGNPQVVLRRVA